MRQYSCFSLFLRMKNNARLNIQFISKIVLATLAFVAVLCLLKYTFRDFTNKLYEIGRAHV